AAAARLEAFASANTEMVQATRTVVFSRGQQLSVKSPNVGNILVGNRWCYFW
ncbi:Sensor histidine kinase GlrK, partial [human gut metagenome]